ncbi:ATP-binding protein [Acidipila rosea]|uniref:ATP-binding protein n=1 Tax=Acidipila rosea TaxID=768535 RepID=UPI00311FC347
MNWLRHRLASAIIAALAFGGGVSIIVLRLFHAGVRAWQLDALLITAGALIATVVTARYESAGSNITPQPSDLVPVAPQPEGHDDPTLNYLPESLDNSAELMAILSLRGKYIRVSSTWQEQFGRDVHSFEELISFESAFPPEAQAEAAALFRRAKNSLGVECGSLQMRNKDGELTEFEASLSCIRGAGNASFIRCTFRDVTTQNRRARMLALQLKASQLVVESTEATEALLAVAEAMSDGLGWDFASIWTLDEAEETLGFRGAWVSPDWPCEEFLRETANSSFRRGDGLPGKTWSQGSPIWTGPEAEELSLQRRQAAIANSLMSGWAIPIRAGNKVIAVMEFFSHRRITENPEMVATVETICASLGQFIARSMQESRIHELYRQREVILNSVADGILCVDGLGRIDFANPAATRMLGTAASRLIGLHFHSLIHAPLSASCTRETCSIFDVLKPRNSATTKETFYRQDDTSFTVEFSLTPLMEHGVITGSVISFHDISERTALDQMKDEFVATVSHELRTPLTSIRGALGLLSAGLIGNVNEKAANLLRIAVFNSDRLVRLINDILDLERLESGRAPLILRAVSLKELVQQAIDALTPMGEASRISLEAHAAALEIEADPDRILQVITNLISNAIKFSPPDSMVKIIVDAVAGGIRLRVIDSGRGIPPDKLETIFDRFQQVDASDSRQKGGTGLGLAISRALIHQHHGRIWAECNAEKGATFTFFLPSNETHRQLKGEDTRKDSVLICSASASTRRAIVAGLENKGHQALEARDEQQAMALANTAKLGAIFLDLSLPGLNGWQTIHTLRSEGATHTVPIIMGSLLHSVKQHHMDDQWALAPINDLWRTETLVRALSNDKKMANILIVEDDPEISKIIASALNGRNIQATLVKTYQEAVKLCSTWQPDLTLINIAMRDDKLTIFRSLPRKCQYRQPVLLYSTADISGPERAQLHLHPSDFFAKATLHPQQVILFASSLLRLQQESMHLSEYQEATSAIL